MKINISKKQYETLIKSIEVSSFIYGPMSDMVDNKYKKDSDEIEELLNYFLQYTNDFDFDKNLCKEGDLHLDEDYDDKILEELELYDEQQMFENLAYELGKRDFNNTYSKGEIDKIKEEHGDYLGVPMYEFEKKYCDEINKNGYKRFYIKE